MLALANGTGPGTSVYHGYWHVVALDELPINTDSILSLTRYVSIKRVIIIELIEPMHSWLSDM